MNEGKSSSQLFVSLPCNVCHNNPDSISQNMDSKALCELLLHGSPQFIIIDNRIILEVKDRDTGVSRGTHGPLKNFQ